MKILYLINSLILGGAEKLLTDTVVYVNEQKKDVEQYIFTLYDKEIMHTIPDNIKVECLYINKFNAMRKIMYMRSFIKKNKISIVHAHLFEAQLLSRFLKTKDVKIINSYHTGFHNKNSIEFSQLRLIADKITATKLDYVFFVSNKVQQDILSQINFRCRFSILPNFCNPTFYYNYRFKADDNLKIVMVGNLRQQKNYHLLLAALAKINRNISVDIYGEGDTRNELSKIIEHNRLNVRLKGKQKITSDLLSKYDLFLMTSKHEGMPVSLIEAITTGLPSLLNDLDELHETANDSAIYFSKHFVEDLVQKLEYIASNKTVLKELSLNTKKTAKKYSIEKYMNQLFNIYK